MIDVKILITILLVHFVADFVLQTSKQALNKSRSIRYLTEHVFVYSIIWLVTFILLHSTEYMMAYAFAGITFVAHWITDYFTSKISKIFFDRKDYHNGFVVVGIDQFLHYLQLIGTYMLLT